MGTQCDDANSPADLNYVGDCAYAQPGVWANQGSSTVVLGDGSVSGDNPALSSDTPIGAAVHTTATTPQPPARRSACPKVWASLTSA